MMKNKILVSIILILSAGLCFADSVVVSQVDNSDLLTSQKIRVYVSATNARGNSISGLQKSDFTVYETPEGTKPPIKKEIIDFVSGANVNEGINMLFLIDNSGSMYTDIGGRATKNESAWRMTYAKKAIDELLPNIKNPADRLALLSFNVKTDTDISLTDDKASIKQALADIRQPVDNERFTELHESLYYAITKMSDIRGRKVIILLSDGEDYPYKPPAGEMHPQFTERQGLTSALDLAQREGISVFTIGIGDGGFNTKLKSISNETGGSYYNARNLNQLNGIYTDIQERVLSEYLMTYYAGMEPADRKSVTVELKRGGAALTGARSYYSSTLFGKPQIPLYPWIFAFILLALLFLFVLWKLKPQNKKAAASLEVLSVEGRKTRIQPMTIMESQHEVTISGDSDADLTISGDSKLANSEVKLFKEGADYTLMSSQGNIKVNNQPVKAKKLRSGDLITVGTTTIVFDGGALKKDPTVLLEKTKTSRLKSKSRSDTKGRSTRTPHS
jgi:Ca-activated chloride channel family protein